MAAFDGAGIRYLVVGGGGFLPRRAPVYKDLDLLIAVDAENVDVLLRVLREYGAPISAARREEFLSEDFVFYFGVPPWRVDLLTTTPGVEFELAYANRVPLPLGGYVADCISRDDLIRAKRASGRAQDLADAENLERSGK